MTDSPHTQHEAALFTTIRGWGIVRDSDAVVGGVVSALGRRIHLAPAPSRLIVALLTFAVGPLVLVAYGLGWAFLPDAQGNIVIQNFGRGVTQVGPLLGIAASVVLGVVLLPHWGLGRLWSNDFPWFPTGGVAWGILVALIFVVPTALAVGAVVLVVTLVRDRRRTSGTAAQGTDGTDPSGADASGMDAAADAGAGTDHPASSASRDPIYALTPAQAQAVHEAQAAHSAHAPQPHPGMPPYTPRKAVPSRPRVPGPGRTFYLLALAWLLLSLAGTAWAGHEGMLSIWFPVAWGLVFITGWGVLLALVSLAGRRQGFQGFVGTVGLIITLVLLWQAAPVRSVYAEHRSPLREFSETVAGPPAPIPPIVEVPSVVGEAPEWDPMDAFAPSYDTVILPATCMPFDGDGFATYSPAESRARYAVGALEGNRTIDIVTSLATVVVEPNTSLRVTAAHGMSVTVIFPSRSIACEVYASGEETPGVNLSVSNAASSLLTLNVAESMDTWSTTVVIEEN